MAYKLAQIQSMKCKAKTSENELLLFDIKLSSKHIILSEDI